MAKKFIIDPFGRPQNSAFHGLLVEPLPYITVTEAGATYVCFYETPKRAVHRITNGKVEVGFGAWDDRANLQYHPVNTFLEVEA